MPQPTVAPYGTWKSPITSELLVADSVAFQEIALDGEDVYWSEMRPKEGGRYVIVKQSADGTVADVTPPGFNARTTVHEYGGGAFLVDEGTVYFSNFTDQRLYRQRPSEAPQPITPKDKKWRYADGVIDRPRNRIICVREDHSLKDHEAVNTIVEVPLVRAGQVPLVSGGDFYSDPRISPDGTRLCHLRWNHPNMPWDEVELWVSEFKEEGWFREEGSTFVAGAFGSKESIYQPSWSPDGTLYFVSDRTGWWNLYRWKDEKVEALWPKEAEFGLPQWVFRRPTYGFESVDSLICVYGENGVDHLARLNLNTLTPTEIPTPFTRIDHLHVATDLGFAVFIGGSPTRPNVIAKLNLGTGEVEELARASRTEIDPGYLSEPQSIEFPTANGRTAFAFYYPPRNQDFTAPADEKPPLVVHSHGGPTGATTSSFRPSYQYWTSRGFAVVDVNYGGSTGYGRAYRERLRGQWGVVDVEDCVAAAEFLVARGEADPKRLCITGGSAGGYTTLCALTFTDVFAAGASHFGLSDLVLFVGDTHKFESRYLDSLVGPFPERRDLYEARSAAYHADRLNCPVIFFQGDEDKIVPPNQAAVLVEALKRKGVPVAYVLFAGEQHGFRKAENIRRSVDGEFYFYSQVFGFEPAEKLEPVEIHNVD